MNKYILLFALAVGFFFGMTSYNTSAQTVPVLTATLSSTTPESKIIVAGSQHVYVAKITLKATDGDVFLTGIYLGTDVEGGLSNFTNVLLYSSSDTFLGSYPNQSENPNLIQFSPVTIGKDMSRSYIIHVHLSDSASGNIRVGFTGFTFGTLESPTLVGVPIYSNVMALPGGSLSTPTPTPTVVPTPTPTPTPQPEAGPPLAETPSSLGFTTLAALNLNDGDTLSAQGSADPDIYIANSWGYKRLFLNPVIFNFYGHLGGFASVKAIEPSTRDMLVTSGLFRNCEANDPKVYGVESTGEDTATLHWVNTSGEQAVQDDPDFFKKVFCINNNEFSWYTQGSVYTSVNQVPTYSR